MPLPSQFEIRLADKGAALPGNWQPAFELRLVCEVAQAAAAEPVLVRSAKMRGATQLIFAPDTVHVEVNASAPQTCLRPVTTQIREERVGRAKVWVTTR